MSVPTTHKAYVVHGNKGFVETIAVPKLKPGEALIKTEAVAINPTDWKHIDLELATDGAVVGCDLSGIVVAIADDVTALKVGDHVLAFISGASFFNPENGAFAEHVAVKADRTIIAPVKLNHTKESSLPVAPITTWEGAASLPVGIYTTLVAFVHFIHIPIAYNAEFNDQYFFVWGGASSLGQAIIQVAKFVGFKVIATASTHNFDTLKELGVEKSFDYREKDVLEQITKYAGNDITYAYDAITDGPTTLDTYSVLSKTRDGTLITSLQFDESTIKEVNPHVKSIVFPLAYLLLDQQKKFVGPDILESPAGLFDSAIAGIKRLNELFQQQPTFIRHMPIKVIPGGLDGLDEALDIVRTGKNSGVKIVVPL